MVGVLDPDIISKSKLMSAHTAEKFELELKEYVPHQSNMEMLAALKKSLESISEHRGANGYFNN